jgi:hypothetical protein
LNANDAEFVVAGSFVDESAVRAAVGALRASGVRDDDVEVVAAPASSTRAAGEVRFVWRLVWIVVLWSLVGGVVGALSGAGVVWAGIGGGGTLAIVLQIIGWMIFGHLIAGMWAGYALLADRSKREFAPQGVDAGRMSIVRVRCCDRPQIDHARRLLDAAAATSVDVIASRDTSRRVS